ncbi:MAG: hypothetical protein LBQ62_09575, partial [Candidatus Accumulibacter sp.]|nr:hypothetical protein [Accumulibacter sp.]
MTATQVLTAYFARKVLKKIGLEAAYREKIEKILNLYQPDSTQVEVSKVFLELYPELSDDASATDQALNLLAKQVNKRAEERGVKIALRISASTEVDKRVVWFEGPAAKSNLAGGQSGRLAGTSGVFTRDAAIIALVTFNAHETAAVLEAFCPDGRWQSYPADGISCNLLARRNGQTLIHCVSEQGENRSQQTCQALTKEFGNKLDAIIGVGIAFGVDKGEQAIGDVLVATSVYDYELTRQTNGETEDRGGSFSCSSRLRQMFWHADQSLEASDTFSWPTLRFGALLSGNKLIDDQKYRDALVKRVRGVIGGEMEGVGIYHAADSQPIHDSNFTHWLVVKAICDWADGSINDNPQKKEQRQKCAAKNAAYVVREVLERYWSEPPRGGKQISYGDLDKIQKSGRSVVESTGIFVNTNEEVKNTKQSVEAGINILGALKDWAMRADSSQFFALLGEYGMGKTIACQRLAQELGNLRAQGDDAPLPLYFDLRHVTGLDKGPPTLAETLEECMERGWIDQNSAER